jgi:hypothetical protein
MPAMIVPILIFVGCFGGGAVAAAKWLPDLGEGHVAGLAFFAVCGLLAAALSIAGLNVYEIVRELGDRGGLGFGEPSAAIFADSLRILLQESSTLFGLAAIVYLLALRLQQQPKDLQPAASDLD